MSIVPTGITRPPLAHVPEQVWPPHDMSKDVHIGFDLQLGGRYVTAECQLGAHHACPGGLRTETQIPIAELRCRCVSDGCSCTPRQEPSR
ncbi:hypothetical protein [Kitasatospora sp. NPDC085879]|uniref:hypothetical protein n=1 Tax=Kitasatospora sp. NPDC085879 TaxID=3154769 RepID=UPI003441E17D